MSDLICPTCGDTHLQSNSLGDELLCKNGHMLAIYDKSKEITIPAWLYK